MLMKEYWCKRITYFWNCCWCWFFSMLGRCWKKVKGWDLQREIGSLYGWLHVTIMYPWLRHTCYRVKWTGWMEWREGDERSEVNKVSVLRNLVRSCGWKWCNLNWQYNTKEYLLRVLQLLQSECENNNWVWVWWSRVTRFQNICLDIDLGKIVDEKFLGLW